jgi:hypothetical protein
VFFYTRNQWVTLNIAAVLGDLSSHEGSHLLMRPCVLNRKSVGDLAIRSEVGVTCPSRACLSNQI